ncbi:MAG: alkaline phosphatase family protein [Chloroflexota bacterium]|nr:alkaline phosphatase family protein [Chloroflexota bacterium]
MDITTFSLASLLGMPRRYNHVLGTSLAAWYNSAAMQKPTVVPLSPVIVIGLDGATWDIARPLMETGCMPNLARLVARGTAGPLASTVPPISAAAWVTFLTGQNPGRHGVYQFRKFDLSTYGGYRDEFATSGDYQGRSLPELVSQRGGRVGSVGVPMTYPPFAVNGFLVSGFPRPFGPAPQVYPESMARDLGRWDEMPDNFNFSLSPEETARAADYWVQKYTDISLDALNEQEFDLFLIVWNSTDNIPHLFWKYADPDYPAYDAKGAQQFGQVINHQYEVADREIGRLLEAIPEPGETTIFVMSDHGMGPYPHRQVHLNAWLAGQGLLRRRAGTSGKSRRFNRMVSGLRRNLPTQWRERLRHRMPAGMRANLFARHMNLSNVDWSETQVYRFKIFPSVEGIVVNMVGRQSEGIVSPGDEYERLCEHLVEMLAELTDPDTGVPIVARASRREELFEGPYLDDIPDILVELTADYTGGAAIDGPLVTPMPMDQLSEYSASHHPTGLFVAAGPGVRQGEWLEGANIVDMAPTILYSMGLPISPAMDGNVLIDLFSPDARKPVAFEEYETQPAADGVQLSADEEAAIREQLAGLGYLRE